MCGDIGMKYIACNLKAVCCCVLGGENLEFLANTECAHLQSSWAELPAGTAEPAGPAARALDQAMG